MGFPCPQKGGGEAGQITFLKEKLIFLNKKYIEKIIKQIDKINNKDDLYYIKEYIEDILFEEKQIKVGYTKEDLYCNSITFLNPVSSRFVKEKDIDVMFLDSKKYFLSKQIPYCFIIMQQKNA